VAFNSLVAVLALLWCADTGTTRLTSTEFISPVLHRTSTPVRAAIVTVVPLCSLGLDSGLEPAWQLYQVITPGCWEEQKPGYTFHPQTNPLIINYSSLDHPLENQILYRAGAIASATCK